MDEYTKIEEQIKEKEVEISKLEMQKQGLKIKEKQQKSFEKLEIKKWK